MVRLALTLGRTLEEVCDLSAAELEVWRQWNNAYGLPIERAEWGRALGAAYVGATFGGKAKPADLIPKAGGAKDSKADREAVKSWFAGLAARQQKDKPNG